MDTQPIGCLLVEDSNEARMKTVPSQGGETLSGIDVLLTIDSKLTTLLTLSSNLSSNQSHKFLQYLCLTLEISGHGVPWFILTGILILSSFITDNQFMWVYGIDLLIILLLDIIMVAPLKLIFKRPRPPSNKGPIVLSVSSVDVYAFPSGHTSRAVAIAMFFCYMPPFNVWTHLWYIWAAVVAMSRIMLGRHHILDVLAGAVAGLFVFEIVRQTCLLS